MWHDVLRVAVCWAMAVMVVLVVLMTMGRNPVDCKLIGGLVVC